MSEKDFSEEQIPLPLELEKCTICLENEAECRLFCGHEYCKNCIKLYIDLKILDGEVLKIPCPTMTCFDIDEILILQFASSEAVVKYHKFAYLKKLESDVNFRWCPQKECKGYDIYKSSNKLKCQECNFEFCFLCAEQWHKGECKSLKNINSYYLWQEEKVKFCPVCHVRTEKNGGCRSVICKKCTTSWCWKCSKTNANHKAYACFVGEKWYNPKISVALIFFFMPIVIIFAPAALFFYMLVSNQIRLESKSKFQSFLLNHYVLTIFLLLILSPLISVLIGIYLLLACSFLVANRCFVMINRSNRFCIIVKFILFPFIILGVSVLMLILFPIVLGFTVVSGTVFLLLKIPGALCACASNRINK
ncbi:hypothetical protein SteCoe_28974 [Stentor coeruleus]|uniref:RBR-type E3 ubiquitin transferase n=1 Tax=Stentor coeruleus TaxID=5963 RepID=A0A1R2B706_9CILI|nr:hypothetical protein SteCoe_28974 [Stentor coeruleus]